MEATSSSSPSTALPNPNKSTVHPRNTAAFKRESRRKRKEKKRLQNLQFLLQDWAPLTNPNKPSSPILSSTSLTDWPSQSFNQSSDQTSWNLSIKSSSLPQSKPPPSADALAQNNALRLCREFLASEYGSDEEDDCNYGRNYSFFKGLFDKEAILREFYVRDLGKGRFYCLVCGKEFVGSVAVAQHASFVSKTRRVMVHRAYGRVVSELLGLEVGGFKDVENAGEDGVGLMGGVEMNVDDDVS